MDTTNQTGQQGSREWTIASWCKKIVNTCEQKLPKCHKFGKFVGYAVAAVATPVLFIPSLGFDAAYAAKKLCNRKVAKHQPGSNQIPASSQNPNEQNTQQQGANRQVAATGAAPDTRTPDQFHVAINKLEMEKSALKRDLENLENKKQGIEQHNNNLEHQLDFAQLYVDDVQPYVEGIERSAQQLEQELELIKVQKNDQQNQIAELEAALQAERQEANDLMQRVETNAQRIDQLEELSAAKDQQLAAMRNELGTNVDALQKVQKYNIEQAQKFEKDRALDKQLVKQYEQQNELLVAQLQLQSQQQEFTIS